MVQLQWKHNSKKEKSDCKSWEDFKNTKMYEISKNIYVHEREKRVNA